MQPVRAADSLVPASTSFDGNATAAASVRKRGPLERSNSMPALSSRREASATPSRQGRLPAADQGGSEVSATVQFAAFTRPSGDTVPAPSPARTESEPEAQTPSAPPAATNTVSAHTPSPSPAPARPDQGPATTASLARPSASSVGAPSSAPTTAQADVKPASAESMEAEKTSQAKLQKLAEQGLKLEADMTNHEVQMTNASTALMMIRKTAERLASMWKSALETMSRLV